MFTVRSEFLGLVTVWMVVLFTMEEGRLAKRKRQFYMRYI